MMIDAQADTSEECENPLRSHYYYNETTEYWNIM